MGKKVNDIGDMVFDGIIGKIPFKIATILFFVVIFINSDIFNDNVLNKFPDAVDVTNNPTPFGTIVKSIFIILAYILIDFGDKAGIL